MPVAVRASASVALNNIQMVDQGATPTTPASGYTRLYFTTDGIKWVDDAGAVNAALEVQDLTVKKTAGSVGIDIDGAAATSREVFFKTATLSRWAVFANSDAEGGANAGSNLKISSFDDAGAFIVDALEITRSSGNFRVVNALEIDGALNHDGTTLGVFNTAPTTKQTVTGSKGANAALTSLLTALAAYGLITDSSS